MLACGMFNGDAGALTNERPERITVCRAADQ
jgi:hypothetical protein